MTQARRSEPDGDALVSKNREGHKYSFFALMDIILAWARYLRYIDTDNIITNILLLMKM